MTAMKSGPARVPLMTPSVLRTYGMRSAVLFVVMILALGASTFMLREAATAEVIGARKGFAGRQRPRAGRVARHAWRHRRGVERRRLLRRFQQSRDPAHRRGSDNTIRTVVGNNALGAGFSGDFGPATEAQLDTPGGVAVAPDGDLIVADSHNNRIRRVDWPTGVIMTIAGSGKSDYDGDDQPAVEAALNLPSAVAAAPNGDIYIADTLNYRVRMIDHATGLIHTIAGDGEPADRRAGRRRRDGDASPVSTCRATSRLRRMATSTSRTCTISGCARSTRGPTSSRRWPATGAGATPGTAGRATDASLAGPAGIALVPDEAGQLTLYIADYYNGLRQSRDARRHHPRRRERRAGRRLARRRAWPSRPTERRSGSPTPAWTGSSR